MRVLLITGSFPPMRCGVGDYSYSLVDSLSNDSEINVGVLTSTSVNCRKKMDRVEIFPIIKSWRLIESLSIIKVIWSWSPDIVHIQYPTQGYRDGLLPWVLPLIAFVMRKKVVQTWHEGYSRRNAFKLVLKTIIPSILIFVRSEYKQNLHPHLRWALWKKKSVLIPNASAIPKVELDSQVADILKKQYLKKQKRLIVFFGFVLPIKGVELLFEIAEPATDRIIIAGEIDSTSEYSHKILKCASSDAWTDKVTITGFLPAADIAALLTVADAVILPFKLGGGDWNTSIHGAVLNGAFVLTTAKNKNGYNEKSNIYFAEVDNIKEMTLALSTYAGKRRAYCSDIDKNEWQLITEKHNELYKSLLK